MSKEVITVLESVRFKFHVIYGDLKKLPNLTDDDKVTFVVGFYILSFNALKSRLVNPLTKVCTWLVCRYFHALPLSK